MSTSPQRHYGRKEPEVFTQSMSVTVTFELFITFLLDLSVLHFQITISLLPHRNHWRAVTEHLIHRATFASRLHSKFKHPHIHTSALCAVPPRAILISYSHTSCLLNSAKLFWICHQGNMSCICFAREIVWSKNRFYTDTLPCVLQA